MTTTNVLWSDEYEYEEAAVTVEARFSYFNTNTTARAAFSYKKAFFFNAETMTTSWAVASPVKY